MQHDETYTMTVHSVAETEKIAAEFGHMFRGGEVIELVSDVGGGKTTFVRGLASGMGSSDRVASPTFTISREYKAGDLTMYHFDFYRLQDPGIIANELAEVIGDPHAVIVIEWAEIVANVLPTIKLRIQIESIGETERRYTYTYPTELGYLFDHKARL
jgi:tRNA threonylcarbamoyladenosine biosynthesis protein TsaE